MFEDQQRAEGHDLLPVDLDQDGIDEVFACMKGPDRRILLYRQGAEGWNRELVTTAADCEDLEWDHATNTLLATGGTTHNVLRLFLPNSWTHPSR